MLLIIPTGCFDYNQINNRREDRICRLVHVAPPPPSSAPFIQSRVCRSALELYSSLKSSSHMRASLKVARLHTCGAHAALKRVAERARTD